MKIYQRFLYVGLGGTGLKIGAQLEQRLRLELCGADGLALASNPAFGGSLSPFELPKFVQFIYADFDERERRSVESASERFTRSAAARNTATFISNLTPHQNSYAKVAESLRTECYPLVREWLPPEDNEPKVAPLRDGAGQYPTVGRAAFFETIRAQGLVSIEDPLEKAIARLANAGGELDGFLGKQARRGCDVFVGFSVAGGTGTGVFYDFLRLVSWKVKEVLGTGADSHVHVYPLVVLPSAFDEGKGGGRAAQLNGGPALRELFAAIDRCNTGVSGPAPAYPGAEHKSIPAEIDARTAFIFRRPEAITIEDLHRSIVSFVVSLIGTELRTQEGTAEGSFASWFVNRAGERRNSAPDGIGRQPASAAISAQLTIPLEQISEILASRLVADATHELRKPKQTENNRDEIQAFIAAAGVTPLQERAYVDPLPSLAHDLRGARDIFAQLTQRRETAVQYVRSFQKSLDTRVAQLAEGFNYGEGVKAVASKHDLFRVARIALGDARLDDNRINEEGVVGFLRRRAEPLQPEGTDFALTAPTPPQLGDSLAGIVKVKLSDPEPRNALETQNRWYEWRTQAEWHAAWAKYAEYWRPKADSLRKTLSEIVEAFNAHATAEQERFQENCHRLYSATRGVVYFLPESGSTNDLSLFYETAVLPRLRERLKLPEGSDEGQILDRIMGQSWLDAYLASTQAPAEQTVEFVLDKAESEIYSLLADGGDEEKPILPRLSTLLAAVASGATEQAGLQTGLVERFRTSVGSLVPAGFEPEGSGNVDVQVFYPAAGKSSEIEGFLEKAIAVGDQNPDFHQIADSNFLGVVITRVALPATQIREYKDLMRLWADAIDNPRQDDYLAWRQRLGFDARWIVLDEDDRVQVLLCLLNAMWDGSIQVVKGTSESPERIAIHQYDAPDAPPIELDFKAYGDLSRWSNVLRAYERYALGREETTSQRCAQLMKRLAPYGVSEDPAPPSDLYRAFRILVTEQAARAQAVVDRVADQAKPAARQALDFWTDTVPKALEREFFGGGGPRGRNHLQLFDSFGESGTS